MKKTLIRKILVYAAATLIIAAPPAHAMHISEGFLPIPWAGLWWLIMLPFLARGIHNVKKQLGHDPRLKIILALAGAFAFVLSALKIPSVTGSCSHPTGIGLCAILFGPAAATVIGFVVLVFQALVLAHGGITTLGANTAAMAIVGALVAYGIFTSVPWLGGSRRLSVFLAAMLGDLAAYMTTSLQLACAFPGSEGGFFASLAKFSSIFAVTQIPLAISEGLLTVMVYNLLSRYAQEELALFSIFKKTEGSAPATGLKRPAFGKNLVLLMAVLALAAVPVLLLPHADFSGADALAKKTIGQINPGYKQWFFSLWEPPSGKIEGLLFALQAALGAGVIGYIFGFMKGRSKPCAREEEDLNASIAQGQNK